MRLIIETWFVTPEGEIGQQRAVVPNGGGWESSEAMKRRLPYLCSRKDLTVDELPNGFRTLQPMRDNCFVAQEVTITEQERAS